MSLQVLDELVENVEESNLDSKVKLLDEMVSFDGAPAEEIRERTLVSTSGDLEEEYRAHREAILNDAEVKQEMQVNESVTGFSNIPEAVVHLDVHEDFVKRGYRKQYNIPQAARDAVTAQVEKWLEAGKITLAPPNCPYNSSLTVAAKKDAYGTFVGWRVCLDTRALNNAILVADKFQLPYIRDVLERFHGCKYFAEIDLSEAYLQFQLDEESRPLTAFTWDGRQFMFVGCPFGIWITCHSPVRLQKNINSICC
jgi:hypothetical protein